MKRRVLFWPILFLLSLSLLGCERSSQDPLHVAVASNFAATARDLAKIFETETGMSVMIIPGSSGKLAAQIQQGAPFHVFLSADEETPLKLVKKGAAIPHTQFTYAIGRLALFGQRVSFPDVSQEVLFELDPSTRLAIANPALAPYGRAAKETLISLDVWEDVEKHLVQGENISQAWHFLSSDSADLGFVAYSQLDVTQQDAAWLIPPYHHTPIRQNAILLQDSPSARHFLKFLASPTARRMVEKDGYLLPPLLHAE